MSWGFFVELELPEDARAACLDANPAEAALDETWPSGDPGLDRAFANEPDVATFADAIALPVFKDRGTRIVALLDRSQLGCARVLGRLQVAAHERGFPTVLRVVNDGTSSGPDGWVFEPSKKGLKRKDIRNFWSHVDRLGPDIWGP